MFIIWKYKIHSNFCLNFIEYLNFIELSFSTFCKSCSWSCPKSIDEFFLTFDHSLLFFISFLLEIPEFLSLLYTIGVVSWVDINSIFSENFDSSSTGSIEKFSIMRYDKISSFPAMFEVVFEPFYTGEIDEVSGFIKEEEFWTREEYFGECNLGSLTSRYFWEGLFEKMEYSNSTWYSFDIIFISVSPYEFVSFQGFCVGNEFSGFCHIEFFFFDDFLEFSNFYESISELVSYCFWFIHKMNLFKVS